MADINGDGRLDMVVTEERYPGPDPDGSVYWFEQPPDPAAPTWRRHSILTEYSLNNLDVADLDRDGDIDIVICEHKGPAERLQVLENNGRGGFTVHELDRGKEGHLGARLSDLDGDGDLDIVSIAWNDFRYLHVWRNDAVARPKTGVVSVRP